MARFREVYEVDEIDETKQLSEEERKQMEESLKNTTLDDDFEKCGKNIGLTEEEKEKLREEEKKVEEERKERERRLEEEQKDNPRKQFLMEQLEREAVRRRLMMVTVMMINHQIYKYRMKLALEQAKEKDKLNVKLSLTNKDKDGFLEKNSLTLEDVKNPSDLLKKIDGIDYYNPLFSKEFAIQLMHAKDEIKRDKGLMGRIKALKNEIFKGTELFQVKPYLEEFPKFNMETKRPKVLLNHDKLKSRDNDRDFQREKPSIVGGFK